MYYTTKVGKLRSNKYINNELELCISMYIQIFLEKKNTWFIAFAP